MVLTLTGAFPPGREAWTLFPALERVEVLDILVENAHGGLAVLRRAVPWNDRLGVLQEGSEPCQRGAVVLERSARPDQRDLHVGEVVAAHEDPGEAGEES